MKILENLHINFSNTEISKISEIFATQTLSGYRPIVEEFEILIAEKFKKKKAVAVCSGTVSIYCALSALGISVGDEVILNPSAILMPALAIHQLGATAIFADNNKDGFGIDIDNLKSLITKKTRAIITVPMWGYPIPMDDLLEISLKYNIPLIEDISQSQGTTWNGNILGSFGKIGCISTQERKLITTGEGGVLITNESSIAEKVYKMKTYGFELNGDKGISHGLNFQMSSIAAAAGITQVKKLDDKIELRKKIGNSIKEKVCVHSWFKEFEYPSHSTQNYYALAFQITDQNISAKKLGKHLNDLGIISDPWRYDYKPLYQYPIFSYGKKLCPNAEKIIFSTFTLPCHEGLSSEDIERIFYAIDSFEINSK